jgi:hypothetical protein
VHTHCPFRKRKRSDPATKGPSQPGSGVSVPMTLLRWYSHPESTHRNPHCESRTPFPDSESPRQLRSDPCRRSILDMHPSVGSAHPELQWFALSPAGREFPSRVIETLSFSPQRRMPGVADAQVPAPAPLEFRSPPRSVSKSPLPHYSHRAPAFPE